MNSQRARRLPNRSAGAFSLVEIITVLAIVAVLAALSFPVYQRVVESSRATACVSNLRQLGIALSLYLSENNNMMPVLKIGRQNQTEEVPVIDNTLDRYVKEKAVFACPSDLKWARLTGTSYDWNVALNGQSMGNLNFFGFQQNQSLIPVLADKEGFHAYTKNKVNILYADGHASKDVSFSTGN